VRICRVNGERLGKAHHLVRRMVFVEEQGIDPQIENDLPLGSHPFMVVGFENRKPVATGRVIIDGVRKAKIGRMAVLKEYRGRGFGRQILERLENTAFRAGHLSIELSAQLDAVGFYDRLGYKAIGEVYQEAGIPHVRMEKSLIGYSKRKTRNLGIT
jgi:predicted GNAT family N-acyltransferase